MAWVKPEDDIRFSTTPVGTIGDDLPANARRFKPPAMRAGADVQFR